MEYATFLCEPTFFSVIELLLGKRCLLNSFGSVCSFPGSEHQHVHLDHGMLFDSEEISVRLPPYCITVVIPLVDIDLEVGTTALWEGSHRQLGSRALLAELEENTTHEGASLPTPKMGDVYLMDYRLVHGGTPNKSQRPRPIVYLVFSRPWFRDSVNFDGQPAVQISPEEYAKVPEHYKRLFLLGRPATPGYHWDPAV